MYLKSAALFAFYFFSMLLSAQDVMYTTAGKKLSGKIVEINTSDVLYYKAENNFQPPAYVISKSDLVLIEFANGTTQLLNSNPASISPNKEEVSFNKPQITEIKKPNLYYLNPNLISINALALMNGDIALIYDREFANGHIALTCLGAYNFNSRIGALNLLIMDSRDKAKKNFDAGVGINFMPRTEKRVQYFAGLLGKYMDYSYQSKVDSSNNQYHYESAKGSQIAIMISNGWIFRISPNFNFKFFGSFGVPINSPELKKEYMGMPKAYLGYCLGYRF